MHSEQLQRGAACAAASRRPTILTPITRDTAGQPRTYRLGRRGARDVGYRRLAIMILGLDVASLAAELRKTRRALSVSLETDGLAPAA
jgi:hypothetical protein